MTVSYRNDCSVGVVAPTSDQAQPNKASIVSEGQQQRQVLVDLVPPVFMKKPSTRLARSESEGCGTEATMPAGEDETTLASASAVSELKEEHSLHTVGAEDDEDDSSSSSFKEESGNDDVYPSSSSFSLSSTATGRRRRGSILKQSDPNQLPPIADKKAVWLQLPKPDLKKIRSSSTPVTRAEINVANPADTPPSTSRREREGIHAQRRVSFHQVEIRNYGQTLGDNPSVSYGPPISLDWDYEESDPVDLEDYEDKRGVRRRPRQMMLNYYHRKNILTWLCGATEADLKAAERKANKIKRERAITKAFLPARKLEEVFQSAARKSKRMGGGAAKKQPKQTPMERRQQSSSAPRKDDDDSEDEV